MLIRVFRCWSCRAVYDYHPTCFPVVRVNPQWVRKSRQWGRMESQRVPGCPACGLVGLLPTGQLKD